MYLHRSCGTELGSPASVSMRFQPETKLRWNAGSTILPWWRPGQYRKALQGATLDF